MEQNALILSFFYFFNIIFNNIELIKRKFTAMYSFIKKSLLWIKKNWKSREYRRFLIIFIINLVIKEIIDIPFTSALIIKFGYFTSLTSTTLIYLFIGILTLKLYDFYRIDIFWIEAFKKAQKEGVYFRKRNCLIKFILKKNKKKQFIFDLLFFFKNPAFMVINKRDGEYLFNGFTSKKIKLLFAVYLITMNVYWNLMVYLGISIWKTLWEAIKIFFD